MCDSSTFLQRCSSVAEKWMDGMTSFPAILVIIRCLNLNTSTNGSRLSAQMHAIVKILSILKSGDFNCNIKCTYWHRIVVLVAANGTSARFGNFDFNSGNISKKSAFVEHLCTTQPFNNCIARFTITLNANRKVHSSTQVGRLRGHNPIVTIRNWCRDWMSVAGNNAIISSKLLHGLTCLP